jgi:hypothetical protein
MTTINQLPRRRVAAIRHRGVARPSHETRNHLRAGLVLDAVVAEYIRDISGSHRRRGSARRSAGIGAVGFEPARS